MRLVGILWFSIILSALLSGAADAQPPDDDAAVLQQFDAESAVRVIQMAEKVETWRQKIAVLRQELGQEVEKTEQQIERWRADYEKLPRETAERTRQLRALQQRLDKMLAGNVSLQSVTQIVTEIEESRQRLPQSVQSWFVGVEQLKSLLGKADAQWRTKPFDAAQYAGFSETAYRRLLQRRVYADVAQQFQTLADEGVLQVIDRLKEPAAYAQNFLDGKFREWTASPLPLDDSGELIAKISPPAKGVSIFSPQAMLGVEVEYIQSELSVKATGLYFEYQPGQLPKPNLTKLQVDPSQNLQGKVFSGLKQLGAEITEEMQLPFKITITELPDFANIQGDRRGGIGFSIEAGLLAEGLVKAKAENLKLYPGNKVDWNDGLLKISYPLRPPVPLGTTPLAFWTLEGNYQPATRKMDFRTKISTLASPPDVVAIDVRVQTELPIKKIGINGALVMLGGGGLELAQVDGEIDFSKGVIAGTFKPGAGALAGVVGMGNGSFELRSERLVMNGSVQLFQQDLANATATIDFQRASASVTANRGFNLFGVNFASNMLVEIRPKFESVKFEAVASVYVSGIEPFGDLWATVTVKGDTAGNDLVTVKVDTFVEGLSFEETIPNLSECTVDNLRRWLQERAVRQYHEFLQNLAQGEKDGRKWAAQLDEKTRQYVSDRLGGAWKTGNPELDALGGELSKEWKNAGGGLSDLSKTLGGGLSDLNQGLQQGGSDLAGSVGLPW